MIKKVLLWIAGCIALAAVLVIARAGFFAGVRVEEKEAGPFALVYEKGEGAYKNSGELIDKIYDKLITEKIESARAFGYYYDNPRKAPEKNLRWIAGCIVENEKAAEGVKKYFRVKKFPAVNALTAEFPLKGKLSIIAGIFKVYPAINRHALKKGYTMGPVMEIYDGKSQKITYVMPVDPKFDAIGFYEPQKTAGGVKKPAVR